MRLYEQIDPGELRRLYVDERLTAREIAAQVGLSIDVIDYALERHEIPRGGHRRGKYRLDPRRLYSLYVEQELTEEQVARIESVPTSVIHHALEQLDIERRPCQESKLILQRAAAEPDRCYDRCPGWDDCLDNLDAPCYWAVHQVR